MSRYVSTHVHFNPGSIPHVRRLNSRSQDIRSAELIFPDNPEVIEPGRGSYNMAGKVEMWRLILGVRRDFFGDHEGMQSNLEVRDHIYYTMRSPISDVIVGGQ